MENQLIKYEKKLTQKQKIIIYFFLYAFIGWILETMYAIYVHKHFVKRGFLFGPICPIYGFGAILLLMGLQKNMKKNNIINFFMAIVYFSIFEYAVSIILEIFFHQRWWDYTNEFMNFQGRICLKFSIIWGIFGVIFVNVIHPCIEKNTEKIIKNLNYNTQKFLLYTMMSIYVIDTVLSIYKNIS